MSGTTRSNEVKTKKLLSLVKILEPLWFKLSLLRRIHSRCTNLLSIYFRLGKLCSTGGINMSWVCLLFFLFQIMIYGLYKYIEKRETVQCKYLRFWSIFLLSNNLAGGKRGAVSSHL